MTDIARVPVETPGRCDVAPAAAFVGVVCRSCGRLDLPARLWPLATTARPGAGATVELQCVRCNAVGSLRLDTAQAPHLALLAVWEDQAPGHGDAKEPA